jgi:hypothetical protein
MRITAFDHSTGKVTVEFDNQTQDAIPVEHAYLTVHPINNTSLKPLPPDLQSLITVFDKRVMRITGWSSIRVAPCSSKDNEKDGRYIYRAVFLVHSADDFVLQPKKQTITTFAPHGAAFPDLCNQFADGAELEIVLHIALLNKKERVCTRKLTIGKYSIGAHHKQFAYDPQLKKVDILRKAEHISKKRYTSAICNFGGDRSLDLSAFGKESNEMLYENISDHDLLLRIYDEKITGLIPVIKILRSVRYRVGVEVELRGDEALPANSANWIFSPNNGKTVMNLPMVFSNDWANIQLEPAVKEYSVPLSSTNWSILVGEQRWAKVLKGVIECSVTEKSWAKFLPADDATASNIISNYSSIAVQELEDDPSWISFTNRAGILTNSNPYVIIQNEVTPDFSFFKTLVPDNLSTNAVSEGAEVSP